jgi:hypothetical protein
MLVSVDLLVEGTTGRVFEDVVSICEEPLTPLVDEAGDDGVLSADFLE